jgi:hypothetical protein
VISAACLLAIPSCHLRATDTSSGISTHNTSMPRIGTNPSLHGLLVVTRRQTLQLNRDCIVVVDDKYTAGYDRHLVARWGIPDCDAPH